MIAFRILMISFFVFTSIMSNAQFIIAGSAGPDDYYKDIDPDSALDALPVHLTSHPGEEMQLDVDSDGVNDIEISTWGGGGLGGGGGACNVTPLHSAVGIVAYKDTFVACCPSQYPAIVADTLLVGDTISVARPYNDTITNISNTNVYIWSTTYGGQIGPSISFWNNTGEHFIGFRLQYNFDTLYGWIRVDVTYPGLFVITIKDFACNRNTHIGIEESLVNPAITLYPNPFNSRLYLYPPLKQPVELTLYTAFSGVVFKEMVNGNVVNIPVDLASGLYLYVLKSQETLIHKGKLIKK